MSAEIDSDDNDYLTPKYPVDNINKNYINKKFVVDSEDLRDAGPSRSTYIGKSKTKNLCSYNLRSSSQNTKIIPKNLYVENASSEKKKQTIRRGQRKLLNKI